MPNNRSGIIPADLHATSPLSRGSASILSMDAFPRFWRSGLATSQGDCTRSTGLDPTAQLRMRANAVISHGWKELIRPILETFAAHSPGAFVEEKEAALSWHYRLADPELGQTQCGELTVHLTTFLATIPVEVIQGNCVIVRQLGANKGIVLLAIFAPMIASPEEFVVAFGSDRTDEDRFAALPEY